MIQNTVKNARNYFKNYSGRMRNDTLEYSLTVSSTSQVIQQLHFLVSTLKTCPHKSLHKDFIVVLVIIFKTWKQSTCLLVEKEIKWVVYPDNGMFFSTKSKWAIKTENKQTWRWTLSAYCYLKEVNWKRLHTAWFQCWGERDE